MTQTGPSLQLSLSFMRSGQGDSDRKCEPLSRYLCGGGGGAAVKGRLKLIVLFYSIGNSEELGFLFQRLIDFKLRFCYKSMVEILQKTPVSSENPLSPEDLVVFHNLSV